MQQTLIELIYIEMHDLYMHAVRSNIHASMQICMYMAAVGYKYSNALFVWLVY